MMYKTMKKQAWNSDDTALATGGASLGGTLAYIAKHPHLKDFNPFGEKKVTLIGGVRNWDPVAREEAAKVFQALEEGRSIGNSAKERRKLLEKAQNVFRMDSFSGQTQAAADALRAAGLDTEVMRRAVNNPKRTLPRAAILDVADGKGGTIKKKVKHFLDLRDSYRPLEIDPAALRGSDAVIQVGDGVNVSALSSARRSGSKIYRLLTDYGDGNFKQPDYWLGQNWMKVTDPGFYDRLFVPGGAERDLWTALGRGKQPNVNLGNIPVSPLFENTKFHKPKHRKIPRGMFTLGGGSQGYITLRNYGAPEGRRYNFLGKDRTLFDDMLGALRANYGPNAQLDAYLGTAIAPKSTILDTSGKKVVYPEFDAQGKLLNADKLKFTEGYAPMDLQLNNRLSRLQELLDPNSERSVKLSKRGKKVQKLLADLRKRYKGLNLIGSVPQNRLAKAYANSDHIFMLDGSTSAEISSIKGQEHGGIIHLIPSDEPWSPGHWRGNAQYVNRMMQPGATKNIVELSGKNRLQALIDAVREGGFKNWGRVAPKSQREALAPLVQAVKKDIMLKRLGRVGKLGLIATPAALSGAYLWKSHSKPEGLWEKIKAKVKEKLS